MSVHDQILCSDTESAIGSLVEECLFFGTGILAEVVLIGVNTKTVPSQLS